MIEQNMNQRFTYRNIVKCTCPLCGKRIDGLTELSDAYFDMYSIVINERNPTFHNLPERKRQVIVNVLDQLRACPRMPLKLGQKELTVGAQTLPWEYMLEDLQVEVAYLIISWAYNVGNIVDFRSDSFFRKWKIQMDEAANNRNQDSAQDSNIIINRNKMDTLLLQNRTKDSRRADRMFFIVAADITIQAFKEKMKDIGDISGPTFEGKVILEALKDSGDIETLLSWYEDGLYLYKNEIDVEKAIGSDIVGSIRGLKGAATAKRRHCPNCNFALSKFSGMYQEIVLTTIGFPRVSKSTTIASNIYFLEKVLGLNVEVDDTLSNIDGKERDASGAKVLNWSDFDKRYYQHFIQGYAVEATNAIETEIPRFSVLVNLPYVNESFVLTIIDIPGEYILNVNGGWDKVSELYREVYKSTDYLWYCTEFAETQDMTMLDASDKHTISMNLGRFQVEYRDGVEQKRINKTVDMEQINSLWTGVGSPMEFLSNNPRVKAMIVLGKTDFSNTEDFQRIFGADKDYSKYKLFSSDFYKENKNKLFGVTDRYIWVDEAAMFEYMNTWRKYFCDHRFSSIIKRFDTIFRHEGGYCAMSAYGFKPALFPNIDKKKYEDALENYYAYKENNGLTAVSKEAYLAKEGFDGNTVRKIEDAKYNQRIPDSFMGGWPILWVMICEGKVRLRNRFPKIEKVKKGLFSTENVVTGTISKDYKATINEVSRRNMLMFTDQGGETGVLVRRNHNVNESPANE